MSDLSNLPNRQTAAFPPKPARANPETDAATLFASPTSTIPSPSTNPGTSPGKNPDPESIQATMFATSDSSQPAGEARGSGKLTLGRGTITVLPEVRSEGERLTLVARDKTRYESDKLLGRGGMGEVKLAHDHDIGRKVAVKRLLHAQDGQDPHAVARFIDEVRTVGSLEHPNIVPIHDVGVDEDGALFFVMKYVEGETLASIIDKLAKGDASYHQRYNFEARLEVFNGLLRALQYAHSQGLVHRDIKPENLMIGRFGEVVVMDWGIAHMIRGQAGDPGSDRGERPLSAELGALEPGNTQTDTRGSTRASNETVDGAVVGTPQYMSPEQAAGEVVDLDGRSDLYSAFTVLFELLTLRPYVAEGGSAMAMVLAARDRQPPAVIDPLFGQNSLQDAIPSELRHFLRHGLANDKTQRYASAEEVIWALERIRSGDCEVECPVTFMKHNNHKLERLLDRRPSLVLGATTLGLLSFLGGLAGWVAWLAG